jgi:hypothetical protein
MATLVTGKKARERRAYRTRVIEIDERLGEKAMAMVLRPVKKMPHFSITWNP